MFGFLRRKRGRRRGGRHRRRPGSPARLSVRDTVEIQRILGGFGPRHAVGRHTPAGHRACALTSTMPIARSLIQEALYPHGRHSSTS
jgi:hypothetical protein